MSGLRLMPDEIDEAATRCRQPTSMPEATNLPQEAFARRDGPSAVAQYFFMPHERALPLFGQLLDAGLRPRTNRGIHPADALPQLETLAHVRAGVAEQRGHDHRGGVVLGLEVLAANDVAVVPEKDAI